MRLTWVAVSGVLLANACGGANDASVPPSGEFKSEIALAGRLPGAADLVGVTVSPEGQRYVLDRNSGLYEISGTRPTLVFAISDLAHVFGQPSDLQFTDVAALGEKRFALTIENDGLLLDLEASTLSRYFCYLPETSTTDPSQPPTVIGVPSVSQTLRAQGIAVKEHTDSLAFSPDRLQLYAQPQTIRLDDNQVVGSELFVFRDSGGQPIDVRSMPSITFLAGGMLAEADGRLLLGSGNQLYAMGSAGGPTLVKQFEAPIDISGLARDLDGDLLLLDRTGRRLLETAPY